MAARPRTLPAAVAPVLVGTALAVTETDLRVGGFVAALLGAILIQVGTNLSNDYSDARRGADTEERLGPVRVTAGGLVPPRQVLVATYVSFALAVACGVYLVYLAGPILLAIGAASILAGGLYTGGPRPYGYEGLGEVFVFLFFGIVAVAGSYYVQTENVEWEAFVLAVPVGLLAAGILVVNNVRDLETDRRAGKRTLAVRLGRPRTRTVFGLMVYVAFLTAPLPWILGALSPWLLLPLVLLPAAVMLVRLVRTHTDGPTLNRALARTGMLQLGFCILLSAGVLLSGWTSGSPRSPCASRGRFRPRTATCASASCCCCAWAAATASPGGARPRRSSPTTACRSRRSARRFGRTSRSCATATTCPAGRCPPPAAMPPTCRRPSPPWTSRCGTAPATARAARSARSS